MCCNNSNQKTLNEVISQMTALTNAVDKLRSEVNTIKAKSHLIKKERIDNESVRRAIIIGKCGAKNCIVFRKLRQYNSIGRAVKGDCRLNVDRHPNEKVRLQPLPTPRPTVTDFGPDSSPNGNCSKKSSSSCSSSEESLSAISSSVLKSESAKESKLKTVRSPLPADRRIATPAAIPHSIGNESNNNEGIGETVKMNNENEKWKNEATDAVSEQSGSSETIASNFSSRNTPIIAHMQVKSIGKQLRTKKIVANKKNPKSESGKSESERTGAVHNTEKSEATVKKEKNQSIKAKMSKGKLMQGVRRNRKKNDTVGLNYASKDGGNKSGELSDNSLNSNENKNTPTCVRCLLLCSPRKKTVSQKLNIKNQNREQTQNSSVIPARTEAEGVVQEPIEPATTRPRKSEMPTKNQQKVNVQSPSNTIKPLDIGDGKLTGPAAKRGSRNQEVKKSQSSSTVEIESNSFAEKPMRNVNKRVGRKRKKFKTKGTVQSPSLSVNTRDSQSNSSAEKIATTSNNMRKKRRNRKKVSQVPVKKESSNATFYDTESYSNFIQNNGTKIVNENGTKDKGTITQKMTDNEVKVSQKIPEIITDKRTQTHGEHVNATKWMETALSESPRREIRKTVKLSDAAVGTTEKVPKSKSRAEDRSSESSLSFETSTTLDTSSEEHFANLASDPIRRWTAEEQLYGELSHDGKLPEVWCPDEKLLSPVCHCKRNTRGQYKIWLLIPFKNKNRSKRCDPCAPCERCTLRRISQDVQSSPRSNDFQNHVKPTSQEFTPAKGYPTLHQNTFENYGVCSSIPSAATERPYLFSNPTFSRNHCSNVKPDLSKGGPHPYHQHLILNNLQKFDPGYRMFCGENRATSPCSSAARMETSGTLTPENDRINMLGSHASRAHSEEHRYPVCNDPNILVPSYDPSNYSLQNPAVGGFRRFEARDPQIESRKPALFQRVANYFFSRKSSEYAYDPSMQFAGHQTCAKLPGDYNIHSSRRPSLQTPQPYEHNVSDPLSRYEVLTGTQRISHNFDQPQSAYTIMSVSMPQPQIIWRQFQVADASNEI